jgi:hypothetical protein
VRGTIFSLNVGFARVCALTTASQAFAFFAEAAACRDSEQGNRLTRIHAVLLSILIYGLQERHPGTDEDQNVYTLAQVVLMPAPRTVFLWFSNLCLQEDLPDLLLSNHDAFFGKLNLLQPPPAALALFPSITTAAAAAVSSPKLASKKAPAKGPIVASPLCSPPSTPRLQDVAATASAAAAGIVELKLESGHVETASVMEEAAALSMNETFQPLPPVSEDRVPSSTETQD